MKAAETDATKRAFVTFGNIFGLALYDREQRNVGTPEPRPVPAERTLAPIEEGFDDQQRQPSISQRALASSSRSAVARPNPNGLSY
jgi:hypothetical protein